MAGRPTGRPSWTYEHGSKVGLAGVSPPPWPSVPSYAVCQEPSPNAPLSVSLRNAQNAASPFLKPIPYRSSLNGAPTTFSLSGCCAAYPSRIEPSVVTASTELFSSCWTHSV